MSGLVKQLHLSKVEIVDVGVDAEETLENLLRYLQEVWWKWDTCKL